MVACSGTDPSETLKTIGPIDTKSFGVAPISMRYDAGSDTMIYSSGGVDVATVPRDTNLDQGSFQGYYIAAEGQTVLRAVSSSGDTTATVGSGEGPSLRFTGAEYGRQVATVLPNTGAATFSGEYVGFTYTDGDYAPNTLIKGIASLTADFGAATISGSVSNRTQHFSNNWADASIPSSDVMLETSSILLDGTFSGTATGGGYNETPTRTITNGGGNFQGLISGATGNEVAGGLQIDYLLNGSPSSIKEIGVFIATE